MKVKQYIFVLILMLVLASCSGNETDIATDNKESISLHNGSNNESTTDETITYMSEENDDELDFVSDTLLCFGVGFGVRHLVVFRVCCISCQTLCCQTLCCKTLCCRLLLYGGIDMKLIAHRGASLERPENSLESLIYAAQLGADAVECDVRPTADGVYVIFHDNNLVRLAGLNKNVEELTYKEMKAVLAEAGHSLLTLEDLIKNYKEKTPILLHIKMNDPDEDFVRIVSKAPAEIICGVQSIQALKTMGKVFPSDHILAFMPAKECYPDFTENGAGIIRLWEHWLSDITPDNVKEKFNVEVWIMAYKNGSMNGNIESLNIAYGLGADGMLLNDIVLGLEWKKKLNTVF